MRISELRRVKNQERKNLTRERLLVAAREIFAAQGYHNTIISDIVKKAGVGQGTFYRNFTNKREIFEALLEMLMGRLLSSFSDMSTDLPTSSEQYRQSSIRAIRKMIDIVLQNRDLVTILLKEAVSVDREIERKILGFQIRFAELAKFYLDHAIEKGFARRCNSDIVSKSIVGLGLSFLSMWLDNLLDENDIDSIIKEVVDFAFFGLVGDRNIIRREK